MDNPEDILHSLEEFSKMKPKDIPRELDDYLCYVAKTGDPVFKWSITKCLFREKLLKVITDFYESTLTIDLPPCPNVAPFNYERMKSSLIEKLDSFHGAPFTVQRISELLTNPRKEYNRADKFMRAIEKNILVVSTREPGKYADSDSETLQDTSFNGIPEPNETPMESSFTCNDLTADPDSSSPSYGTVTSENHDTFTTKVDIDTAPQQFNKSQTNPDESPSEESNPEKPQPDNSNSNEETPKEDHIVDKESESVICSTVPVQADSDSSENDNSNESTAEAAVSTPEESFTDKTEVEDTNVTNSVETQNEEVELKPEEPVESEKVDCSESVPEKDIKSDAENEIVTEIESSESASRESDSSDIDQNKVLETEICSESENSTKDDLVTDSQTVISNTSNERPVTAECDTSNSCDSDSETKQDPQEFQISQSEIPVTSENEVTTCGVYMKDGRIIVNEFVMREASVIHVTACEPEAEAMEVDECQISSVEESESSLEEPQQSTVSSMDTSPTVSSMDTSETIQSEQSDTS